MNTRFLLQALLVLAIGLHVPQGLAGGKKQVARAALNRMMGREAVKDAGRGAVRNQAIDRARDARTTIRATALEKPITVWRYTTSESAERALRAGTPPHTHFTPRVSPGRPPSSGTVMRRYGLPEPPDVRMTVRIPQGTVILRNKAIGGEPGRGELLAVDRVPPNAITRLIEIPR